MVGLMADRVWMGSSTGNSVADRSACRRVRGFFPIITEISILVTIRFFLPRAREQGPPHMDICFPLLRSRPTSPGLADLELTFFFPAWQARMN